MAGWRGGASFLLRTHFSGQRSSPLVDIEHRPEYRNIVQGILTDHVTQVEPVGDVVHPQHPFQPHRRSSVARLRVMRLDQGAEFRLRHQPLHARQKLPLARRPAVFLKSSGRRQRQLLHRFIPCDQNSLSECMTKELFAFFDTYSVFL